MRRAFQGIWSLTWRRKMALRPITATLAMILVVPLLAYFTTDPGRTNHFFHWVCDFYLQLMLPLYCLALFGDLIRDELQGDTLGFIITRPLTRARLFLMKFLCQGILAQLVIAVCGLFFLMAGGLRQIPGILTLAPLILGTQVLAVAAYGALSSLLGLISKRYLVLGVVYGFVVEVGIARIPTNINSLALSRHIKTLLANHEVIRQVYEWSPQGALVSLAIMVLATALFLAAATLLFTFREYHHSEEMQK